MAYNFLPCDRNQAYLLPLSLVDWLPEDHLAWFVLDAVEQIDLKPFYKKYRTDGIGNSAFNPVYRWSPCYYTPTALASDLADELKNTVRRIWPTKSSRLTSGPTTVRLAVFASLGQPIER